MHPSSVKDQRLFSKSAVPYKILRYDVCRKSRDVSISGALPLEINLAANAILDREA